MNEAGVLNQYERGERSRQEIMVFFRERYRRNEPAPDFTELSPTLGLNKSTIHRHLGMLVVEGKLVHRAPYAHKGYELSKHEKEDVALDTFNTWWVEEGLHAVTHSDRPGREGEAQVAAIVLEVFKRNAFRAWMASRFLGYE